MTMSESAGHITLVQSIKRWLLESYQNSGNLCLYLDSPFGKIGNKPPVIDGFIPDVYAILLGEELIIIGEAKTAHDLETRHTKAQLEVFLRHCSNKGNAILVIAVPWNLVNSARSLIRFLKKKSNTESVNVKFLELLPNC
jgi:hypothetical protein